MAAEAVALGATMIDPDSTCATNPTLPGTAGKGEVARLSLGVGETSSPMLLQGQLDQGWASPVRYRQADHHGQACYPR